MGTVECPMTPTARQADFLALECDEALYGGAAGGGKTEALLMWLAEGVHIPRYSGIIFRRTFAQLGRSNEGLIAKSHFMYLPMGGKYNGSDHEWTFASGAKIALGQLQHEKTIYDHQGPSYHRIAWDELTQFSEEQYLFLMGRKRKLLDFSISVGVRAATNPGGEGHMWVKNRFVPNHALEQLGGLDWRQPSESGLVFWTDGRAFVPARVADNPYLDVEDYVKKSLMHLRGVMRERLMNGDWSVVEDAQFHADWLRYYTVRGGRDSILDAYQADGDKIPQGAQHAEIRRFATVDTAGTSDEKARDKRGKPASWSVCAIWDYAPDYGKFLFLRHVWRKRVAWLDLKSGVMDICREWDVSRVYIENAHFGPTLGDEMNKAGFRVERLSTKPPRLKSDSGKPGKLERATQAINKMERGEIFLPRFNNDWLPTYEAELLSWSGDEDETADQIDVTSYAVNVCERGGKMVLSRVSADANNLRGWGRR